MLPLVWPSSEVSCLLRNRTTILEVRLFSYFVNFASEILYEFAFVLLSFPLAILCVVFPCGSTCMHWKEKTIVQLNAGLFS